MNKVFSLRIPLDDKKMRTPFDVASALEYAARQLRNAQQFGTPCADGFTTQNILVTYAGIDKPVGTYAVKDSEDR